MNISWFDVGLIFVLLLSIVFFVQCFSCMHNEFYRQEEEKNIGVMGSYFFLLFEFFYYKLLVNVPN